MPEWNKRLSDIKLVATDCDGVLTDGGLYYSENGDEMKRFQVLDGMGFLLLREAGIKTAIITSDSSNIVKRRAERLKVDFLVCGTKEKLNALSELCESLKISIEEAAYIGDDIFDVPAIEACGFGCVPQSADSKIKACRCYVTSKGGGEGAFREIADLILENR